MMIITATNPHTVWVFTETLKSALADVSELPALMEVT